MEEIVSTTFYATISSSLMIYQVTGGRPKKESRLAGFSSQVEKAAKKNSFLFSCDLPRQGGLKGSIPIAFHEGKDPFFIAVTKAPEEKEIFSRIGTRPTILDLANSGADGDSPIDSTDSDLDAPAHKHMDRDADSMRLERLV
ncbi:hypothetical protein RND71_015919 [Anisodus tanguticus]|uniref:Uncharacterized protein n=1 Tax=Anisodus tanguticus TaxID=243964 RepID=A0AAE1S767_9SOLA|nr:hypothetical protein RND71_015919 [Anisodus tanguticus]